MIYRLFSLAQLIVLLCVSASSFAQVDKKRAGAVPAQDFYKRYTLLSADPSNLEMVPDPAGGGETVLKARVRNTDEKIVGGIRTEILPTRDYTRAGVARWYAVSVYFPKDWEFHPTPVIVSQLHTSQKKAVLQPPVSLIAWGNNLNLELHYNHRAIEGDDATTKQNSAAQMIRLDKIKTEQWYCFVMFVDWSHTPGKGAFRLWMNGD
ncbi:MAG: heparin lyase I family protein, partial [Nitrosospira sp.]